VCFCAWTTHWEWCCSPRHLHVHHHLRTRPEMALTPSSAGRHPGPHMSEDWPRVQHNSTSGSGRWNVLSFVIQVGAELGTTFNDVLAPQDVATYGALCSLASFSRPEMKTRIIDNIAFREFLELMPEVQIAIVQI
jgi:hypothetical protein